LVGKIYMCGIVGGISKKIREDTIEKMMSTINHRGPDASGIFLDKENNVFLGHQRLAIIDLSEKANQPFQNQKSKIKNQNENSKFKNCVITYNGEVYNYKEIRKELEKKGYKFKSNSDTEVVLNSYVEWGNNCVKKFRGMFAFAVWDAKEEKLILFRDRFGVKPLYYYVDGQNFIFASELKAIYQFSDFRKEIDFSALSFYLQLGFIPAPYTIFKNTYKLEQGSILEVDLSGSKLNLKIAKYWQPEGYFKVPKTKISEKEVLADLEKLLRESFRYRMVADVDVGMFLSGGTDSSLVAAMLQKNSSQKLKTFTIGFEEKSYDEAPYARKVAEILGTDHHEYYLSIKDLESAFEKYAEIFDEPFGDSSGLPTYLLAKFARENVKVALSGDGGDELFWGYSKYRALEKFGSRSATLKEFVRRVLIFLGPEKIAKIYSIISKFLPLPKHSNLREKISKLTHLLKGQTLSEIFQLASSYWLPNEIQEIIIHQSFESNLNEFYPLIQGTRGGGVYPCHNLDPREQMQVWDIKNYLCDDILVKTDRATMAVGLEAREPYLDQKILEYIAQLPPEIKFKEPKYLLKQVLYKYLPKKLFDRPKTGFRPPIYELFKNNFQKYVGDYLSPAKIKKQGIFNAEHIEGLINKYQTGKYINPDKIWLLVAFQMWFEKWC